MHNVDWKIECRNLGIILLLAGLVGWAVDLLPWFLFFASLTYIGWTLFQLQRVQSWLSQQTDTDPPESKGLWGDVLDGIYRLQRQGKEERSRLQAWVDYLQDSFASLDDGAVMIDKRGNIEWSNVAAEKLLGLRYPDDKSQQLVNLIRAPDFIRYFEGDDYSHSLLIESPHNNHYQLQINISYFGRGSRLLFARDVTENNRLQQMRKDFVANVSHELRTPLTVINGYLETLSDNIGNQGNVQNIDSNPNELRWRRAVDQMLGQSHRMEGLIKDLMALSKLESIPEDSKDQPIELEPMLQTIKEEVLAAFKGKRLIHLECDASLRLMGNSDELRSAFANLVMNAAKYSHHDGEITVRWFGDSQHCYLEVEDNGEGIDDIHLPRLTERFYRVDKSRSIETGGTGLGLAIVKHILLRHQAELKIKSTLGEGSTFTCEFPGMRALAQSHTA
ncbi:phosphate regulon sensor histidine kinase PhoR [Oceanicoccus sagamiensis]|uniref:Phosphate regulon sensor protein PhoR n=1 Tax=Oceanicoccus sagamiensis TaxID=716816 RepID=A0A1X9NF47_9GAMM|nr:phosphate regulon sensor histidine kinase PhoR [Oceanicoccus sagamiensis]ARN76156.1 PAS domain-containing sensor histidine kinase [Oceanicoccus sagamiensis]